MRELLGLDLATVRELAAMVEPDVRADGTRVWSLVQLEREAYGRRHRIEPVHRLVWCLLLVESSCSVKPSKGGRRGTLPLGLLA